MLPQLMALMTSFEDENADHWYRGWQWYRDTDIITANICPSGIPKGPSGSFQNPIILWCQCQDLLWGWQTLYKCLYRAVAITALWISQLDTCFIETRPQDNRSLTEDDSQSWPNFPWNPTKDDNLTLWWPVMILTHWGRDKMATISQTIFTNAFSWMKMFEFWSKFHLSLFLRIQLTIFQHWFR